MRAQDLRFYELIRKDPETGFPLILSTRCFPVTLGGAERMILDIVQSIGRDRFFKLQFRQWHDTGMGAATLLGEAYQFDSPYEWFMAQSVVLQQMGFARQDIGDFKLEEPGIRFSGTWKDSINAIPCEKIFKGRTGPVCAGLCGFVSGYSSAVLGTSILVREKSCVAQGPKFCSFEGRPVSDWEDLTDTPDWSVPVENLDEKLDSLQQEVKAAIHEIASHKAEISRLRAIGRKHPGSGRLVYRSRAMGRVMDLAGKVAATGATVLIQGESGTGKELIADYIHTNSSRSKDPFLAVNCAALPENLLESELFGHTKGAFTGADSNRPGLFLEAGNGTLFLDEVGELPLALQAKLLRALQERQVRPVGGVKSRPFKARVLSAANRDLKQMVQDKTFREDLYYRLAVFPIFVPPLRDRREDILLLARHFLERFDNRPRGFTPEALRKMEAYPWPGNVRELQNWIEYALVIAQDGELISPVHLPDSATYSPGDPLSHLALDMPSRDELERRYIETVLEHTGGNRTEAARILKMGVTTLWRRLNEKREES